MKIAFAIIGQAHAAGTTETGTQGQSGQGETAAQPSTQTTLEPEAGHGGGTFPPFDPATFASQLLWLAITFGIFYLLMSRLAIPRVGEIIETRRNRITQDLDEANRLKGEADAAQAAYEHELAEARNRATSIGNKARDEAKAKIEAERHKVEAGLAAKLADAEARIAGIKAKALKEVGTIAAATTGMIVSELLGSTASEAEIALAIGSKR